MNDETVLRVKALSKSFGGKPILDGIDIRLGPGDRLGLSGPNGSGKTTLLRCLSGTVAPDEGTVDIGGFPGGSVAARSLTGVALAHEKAFYQRLSGLQNLSFYATLRWRTTREARADIQSLVEELEIGHFVRDRVDRYSSGMLQQLGLARSLTAGPALLILDEPTRSLDSDAMDRMWDAIDRRPELSIVLASHRQSDLDRCPLRIDLS